MTFSCAFTHMACTFPFSTRPSNHFSSGSLVGKAEYAEVFDADLSQVLLHVVEKVISAVCVRNAAAQIRPS
jgi:hypothetical protein